MTPDPLAALLELADVRAAVQTARGRVDQAMADRALRRQGGQVAAEVSLRSAVASAALSGARYELDEVRSGTVTDPVLQGALRVAEALPGLADRWPQAPRQVLARLHVLAARETVPTEQLGRPIPSAEVAARLHALAGMVTGVSEASPLIRAAIVHAELLTLRPFAGPYGVVARAAARLTLIAGGFDPRGLIATDVGHLAREPEYVGAAGAYATGTADGVRAWLKHCCAAVEEAAGELTAAAAAL